MNPVVTFLLLSVLASAQTQVSLRNQSKDVDFGSATSTRPAKTGTTLPASCQVGDLYFKSNEAAGANLFGCTGVNTWTVLSGSNKSEISFCTDQGAVNTYSCNLSPAAASYQVGLIAQFRANSTNTGPATANFNALGAKSIKKHGNQELQNLDILAGQMVTLVYDGSVFQMQSEVASFLQAGGSGMVTVNRSVYPWTIDIETSLLCTTSGSCAPTGAFDLSGSSMTKPSRMAASEPALCAEGEMYYNTTTHKRRNCTAQNAWSDEAADQAAPAFTAGNGWYAPFGSGVADAAALTATPHYFQIVVPQPMQISHLTGKLLSDAAPGTAVAAALYSASGTRIVNAYGRSLTPTTGALHVPFGSAVNLPAGLYYIGIASEDATISIRVTDLIASVLNINGALRVATGSNAATGTGSTFTMPATMGTLTAAAVDVPALYLLP